MDDIGVAIPSSIGLVIFGLFQGIAAILERTGDKP
jgi:hypothetical protein